MNRHGTCKWRGVQVVAARPDQAIYAKVHGRHRLKPVSTSTLNVQRSTFNGVRLRGDISMSRRPSPLPPLRTIPTTIGPSNESGYGEIG